MWKEAEAAKNNPNKAIPLYAEAAKLAAEAAKQYQDLEASSSATNRGTNTFNSAIKSAQASLMHYFLHKSQARTPAISATMKSDAQQLAIRALQAHHQQLDNAEELLQTLQDAQPNEKLQDAKTLIYQSRMADETAFQSEFRELLSNKQYAAALTHAKDRLHELTTLNTDGRFNARAGITLAQIGYADLRSQMSTPPKDANARTQAKEKLDKTLTKAENALNQVKKLAGLDADSLNEITALETALATAKARIEQIKQRWDTAPIQPAPSIQKEGQNVPPSHSQIDNSNAVASNATPSHAIPDSEAPFEVVQAIDDDAMEAKHNSPPAKTSPSVFNTLTEAQRAQLEHDNLNNALRQKNAQGDTLIKKIMDHIADLHRQQTTVSSSLTAHPPMTKTEVAAKVAHSMPIFSTSLKKTSKPYSKNTRVPLLLNKKPLRQRAHNWRLSSQAQRKKQNRLS